MSDTSIKRVGIDAHTLGDHSGSNETYYRNILENMVVPVGIQAKNIEQEKYNWNLIASLYRDEFELTKN